MRYLRLLWQLFKGVYDILASYLLAWILLFALVGAVLQGVLLLAVVALGGFETTEAFWSWLQRAVGVSATPIRLVLFGLIHAGLFWSQRRRLRKLQQRFERSIDRLLAGYRRWAAKHRRGRACIGTTFSLVVTALFVPFVIQPTLVPLHWGGQAWLDRSANLLDGSASTAVADSVVGLYRKLLDPALGGGARPPADSGEPLMDRWDPLIRQVVGGDDRAFAVLKAFVYVESAGRQFAVSSTGCVGLTQFCARTARSGGFRRIFGIGQVYPCNCRGRCRVAPQARHDLEQGDPKMIAHHRRSFPCDLTDARFDARKSIAAGRLYVRRLGEEFAGNIYLMYIGYNSGPQVARRLWAAIGGAPAAGLPLISKHLPAALLPYYGKSADRRARSLVKVHLPKLWQAYLRYSGKTSN